jgi:hypothetical protein
LRRRIRIAGLVLLLALGLAYRIAVGVMIARAVLPSHSTRIEVLMALVKPPYQMAAPHYRLLKEARKFFSPSVVHAQIYCGTSKCSGLKSMAYQFPNCDQGNANYCPNCTPPGCTPYHCVPGNPNQTCDDSYYQPAKNCQGYTMCQTTGACTK